jgi:hypothetical protein
MPNISELSYSICEIIRFMLSSPNVNSGWIVWKFWATLFPRTVSL